MGTVYLFWPKASGANGCEALKHRKSKPKPPAKLLSATIMLNLFRLRDAIKDGAVLGALSLTVMNDAKRNTYVGASVVARLGAGLPPMPM